MINPSTIIKLFKNFENIPQDLIDKIIDKYSILYKSKIFEIIEKYEKEIITLNHELWKEYLHILGTPLYNDVYKKEFDMTTNIIRSKIKMKKELCYHIGITYKYKGHIV